MDPTLLVLRWAHVLAAIVALGAVIFARFGLLPALAELDEETRERIHDRIRRAWLPWVIGAITLLLASGLANFLLFNARVREEGWGGGEWMRQTSYHSLFGAKVLLAFVAFYLASGLVGRGAATQWLRDDRPKWLTVTIGTMLAVVLLSGWMRQLHTGPNLLAAGESGVRMDTTAVEGRREGGGDADGQEGQEADRGAAAEDREAPAAAGGGQEAAR